MKNITFTSAGIALLILLQIGTITYMVIGHQRGNHKRGHFAAHHQMSAGPCSASFKEGDRGPGKRGKGAFHGSHRGPGAFGPMAFEDLNLTKEQQTKIDALQEEHAKSEEAIRVKLRELRMKQFQLLKEEKLDDAQAESIATQLGQYKKEEALSRMKFFRAVQQVLTKEQKETLKERMEKHHKGVREDMPDEPMGN